MHDTVKIQPESSPFWKCNCRLIRDLCGDVKHECGIFYHLHPGRCDESYSVFSGEVRSEFIASHNLIMVSRRLDEPLHLTTCADQREPHTLVSDVVDLLNDSRRCGNTTLSGSNNQKHCSALPTLTAFAPTKVIFRFYSSWRRFSIINVYHSFRACIVLRWGSRRFSIIHD